MYSVYGKNDYLESGKIHLLVFVDKEVALKNEFYCVSFSML